MDFLISHEGVLRLGVFAALLAAFIMLETLLPRKARVMPRARRWLTNFAIVGVDTVLLRLIFPLAAAGTAVWANQAGFGLFNLVALPLWLTIVVTVIVLDALIYVQHIIFHRVPIFWAMHKVHHTDRDLDVTSALRFHPAEIIVSMLYKLACVALLGVPVAAVIIFEILLNGTAMFNHANLRLPLWLDKALRIVLVTPDMHRVHHSVIPKETNSNYGFCLPWWDRLFRTYRAQPEAGHEGMIVGLKPHQDERPANLLWSLALPFRRMK
ncbi:sterol desaturase family protein [Robiginitomaculum antarcticum]|uniref:sterol desaturase family protein n=1 Tax=Robiginitomaculum antarcticum TaxID=437507 RepID=UPI000361BC47|nr:sterol desaturase family protein [Robiginitomaculum antarcticum]